MDTKRLILFVIFSMSILMLWDAWQRQHAPAVAVQQTSQTGNQSLSNETLNQTATIANVPDANSSIAGEFKLLSGQRIKVTTDLFKADIETIGGDLRRLELLKHRASDNDKSNFVLLDDAAKPVSYTHLNSSNALCS